MKQSFYIIDGSSYIFRAYYAIRSLATSKGFPTNAIYGFTKMLIKIIKEKEPDYLAMVFDSPAPTFRHRLYQDYKAHRPPMPEALGVQIPYIHKAVEALGVGLLSLAGYEADDIIGTLAKRGEADGLQVIVVSGDKDLFQLISPSVMLYDTLKEKRYTEADIRARFGMAPYQLVEMMGLMGDPVDNIPGVHGIGEKTAISLVAQFGTLEHLFANLHAVQKRSIREVLQKEEEAARLSRRLATLDTDCPIAFHRETFQRRQPDLDQLLPLLQELEFSSLFMEFSPADRDPIKAPPRAVTLQPSLLAQQIVALKESSFVAMDLGPVREEPCPMALASSPEAPFCILFDPKTIPDALKEILESDRMVKVVDAIKPLLPFFKKCGITLWPIFDVRIAAYLLRSSQRDASLEMLALTYLQKEIPKTAEEEPKTHCLRAAVLHELAQRLRALLQEQGLLSLFETLEMPLVTVLAEMEEAGIKLDPSKLTRLSRELTEKLALWQERIYALAGREFNVNSPKQLGQILFHELHLPSLRKTKTGDSTDEEVLTRLASLHELPAVLLEHRQGIKLKSTYLDPLLQQAQEGGNRIHTTLHQMGTATGRLSSSSPNLQNIPIRGEWGQKVREAFIAEEGYVLLSADYNQIELRVLAHFSDDPVLIQAFREGADIHLCTASDLFGLPKEVITKEMRRVAKTVNFGILYGISPFGLASSLGILQREAKRYIDLYFLRYAGVKRFIEKTIAEAAERGYVTTLLQRRREIADLTSRNKQRREAASRLAVNTPIQGSAADIIKLAMIALFQWMKETRQKSRMILQVHDELLFEVPEGEVSRMQKEVVSRMESALSLVVPLTVDVGIGANWWEAKPG